MFWPFTANGNPIEPLSYSPTTSPFKTIKGAYIGFIYLFVYSSTWQFVPNQMASSVWALSLVRVKNNSWKPSRLQTLLHVVTWPCFMSLRPYLRCSDDVNQEANHVETNTTFKPDKTTVNCYFLSIISHLKDTKNRAPPGLHPTVKFQWSRETGHQ